MEGKESRELEQRYQKLDSKKTLLMRLDETLPWEEFRPLLEQVKMPKPWDKCVSTGSRERVNHKQERG
jgi:hypothetical protein